MQLLGHGTESGADQVQVGQDNLLRLELSAGKHPLCSARPAIRLFVQTFSSLVTFHPHIYALVTDGVFDPNGVFWALPPIQRFIA